MTRYYFDVFDGHAITRDQVGFEIDDTRQVCRLAVDALPDLAREQLPDGDQATFSVTVRNDGGAAVFRATLMFVAEWLPTEKNTD